MSGETHSALRVPSVCLTGETDDVNYRIRISNTQCLFGTIYVHLRLTLPSQLPVYASKHTLLLPPGGIVIGRVCLLVGSC